MVQGWVEAITLYLDRNGLAWDRVKGVGLGAKKAKSEVNITARIIDATTGEILVSAKGHGESSKGGGA